MNEHIWVIVECLSSTPLLTRAGLGAGLVLGCIYVLKRKTEYAVLGGVAMMYATMPMLGLLLRWIA